MTHFLLAAILFALLLGLPALRRGLGGGSHAWLDCRLSFGFDKPGFGC
jgi:hypothetical protein